MADRSSMLVLVRIVVEMLILLATMGTGIGVAAMVGVTRARMKSLCYLSADVKCTTIETPEGQKNYYQFTDALPSACDYCLAIQILAVLIAPVIAVYRVVVNLKPDIIKVLRIIVTAGVVVFAILVLVVAAIISAGLTSLCNKLNDACPLPSKIDCVHFQKLGWDPDFDGSAFYDMTKTAEGAAWVSFVLWTALAVWFSVLFLKSRRRPSLREKNAAAGSTPVDVPI